jgi:hypothetical protein
MRYHVTKLDRRHSWFQEFDYMLEFSRPAWHGTGVLDFNRCRRWFQAKFGWSQDVETRHEVIKLEGRGVVDVSDEDINSHWAYSTRYRDFRIYVATSKELEFFLLSHPVDN